MAFRQVFFFLKAYISIFKNISNQDVRENFKEPLSVVSELCPCFKQFKCRNQEETLEICWLCAR